MESEPESSDDESVDGVGEGAEGDSQAKLEREGVRRMERTTGYGRRILRVWG